MMTNKTDTVQLYTDGACSGNPGPGGWAWVLVLQDEILLQGSGNEEHTTNNRMELLAAIDGLKNFEKSQYRDLNLQLITDSVYVKQGISTWIKNWKKNNWRTSDKKPVKNQDLWELLDALYEKFSPECIWVRGHATNKFNIRCDTMAVQAARQVKGSEAVSVREV